MADKRLDPVDLEYFVSIVELGSLGAAAEALGVSQPGLSKCVQRLERALGVPLLVRSARGIAPTGMGEHLLHHARHLLAELDATQRAMRELAGGGVGRVRLGLSPSLATEFAPELCALAHKQRPTLTLQVVEGLYEDLLMGLRQRRFDLILSTPPAAALPPEVAVEPLGADVFVAFVGAAHPLAGGGKPDERALIAQPWALAPAVGTLRQAFRSAFEQRGLEPPHPAVETWSSSLCRTLIVRHGFATFLPRGLMADDVKLGRVVELPLAWLRWERRLSLMHLGDGRQTPAVAYVRDLVRTLARRRLRQPSTRS